MQYRTADGDRLDSICQKRYGHLNGTVEKVLEANPHLSELPPVLTSGIIIDLPEIEAPKQQSATTINLWD